MIDRLLKLDSCAVSDALDKLALSGAVLGIHPIAGHDKIAGRVVTVKLVPAAGRDSIRHLCTAAIEASGPGDVLIVAHEGRVDCAGWGGILSRAAKFRGISGTIVDGAVRDVDESRAIGYPVFARAAVPLTARGRVVEGAWNQPVVVGGVPVRPGNLVIADGSGVVFVTERTQEVLRTAEKIAARERMMTEAIDRGERVSEVMGRGYEGMLGGENDG